MTTNNDFIDVSDEFTERLQTAQEEIITFMNGETVALAKEAVKYFLAVRDNPERTGKNVRDLVETYPGGAFGLAGAGLTVLKAMAAKRKEAKAGPKGRGRSDAAKAVFGLSVVEEAELDEATAGMRESMRRHPAGTSPMHPNSRAARRAEMKRASEDATIATTMAALDKGDKLLKPMELPRVVHQGEWVELVIPEIKLATTIGRLRAALSQEIQVLSRENMRRKESGLEPTTGNRAATGYLTDLDGMLRQGDVDLRIVISMIKAMGDSVSVPAQEVATHLVNVLVEVSN